MKTPEDLDRILLPDICLIEDVARHLKRSPSTIRRLLQLGILPGQRIAGRWVMERGQLLEALRSAPLPPSGNAGNDK